MSLWSLLDIRPLSPVKWSMLTLRVRLLNAIFIKVQCIGDEYRNLHYLPRYLQEMLLITVGEWYSSASAIMTKKLKQRVCILCYTSCCWLKVDVNNSWRQNGENSLSTRVQHLSTSPYVFYGSCEQLFQYSQLYRGNLSLPRTANFLRATEADDF